MGACIRSIFITAGSALRVLWRCVLRTIVYLESTVFFEIHAFDDRVAELKSVRPGWRSPGAKRCCFGVLHAHF